jgi:hypothetical protein
MDCVKRRRRKHGNGDHSPEFQRKEAHKFYFREGMYVVSFNFRKDMSR